jgi:hypothetical protein
MEPRKSEEPLPAGREGSPSQRLPERKRRFQIIKLEERIAPGRGGTYYCYHHNNGSDGLGKGCVK